MADVLTFYTHPMSRGRMIRWMLEEVGHPYQTEILDYASTMKQAPYLTINPMGKVPAIRHGDAVVTECAAICAYLADAFPEAGLAPPPASKARAPYYRWLFFAAGCVEPATSNKAAGFTPSDQQKRMFGYGTYEQTLDALEGAVSEVEYLAGGKFSAADVYVGSQLGFGMTFGTIEKRPAFEVYLGRLAVRPAYKHAEEIDNALIAEMQKTA
jgi:glutathione S-transferase